MFKTILASFVSMFPFLKANSIETLDPMIYYLQETHLTSKGIHRLTVKWLETIYQAVTENNLT